MAKTFSPDTPIERAVYDGKYDAVVALLRAMSAGERKAQRASALRMIKLIDKARYSSIAGDGAGEWGGKPNDRQTRAAGGCIVVCGTAKDAAEHYDNIEDVIALAQELHPPSLQGLADEMMRISPFRITGVQRLIVAGLAERPDSDAYTLGLMSLTRSLRSKANAFDEVLAADPGLKGALLRIMEIEGTSEFNLAAIDKYSPRENSWAYILLSLCTRGVYSRETLLDKTLSGLEHDWMQFRSSWFSRFHVELAPSVEEMTPHLPRYLALCHSRIPPTVALALGVIKELDAAGLVDSRKLLEALRPVMSSSVKAQVDAALKLLDRAVKRDASLGAEAAGLIAPGLAHESADVQKQVLRRLEGWGVDENLRQTLRGFASGIAAVNRKALEQLVGGGTEPFAPGATGAGATAVAAAKTVVAQGMTPPTPAVRPTPLDPSRRLEPIASTDELVERIAYVFENPTDIDEFERAIAALVQSTPLSDDARARFGPIAKRIPRVRHPISRALARLASFVLTGEQTDFELSVDHSGNHSPVEQLLIARIGGLKDVAAQGKGQPPLSAPTHRRGFIDPAAFVERVTAHQALKLRSSQSEQILALLRLTPGAATEEVRTHARALEDSAFTRALRYALGDDIRPGSEVELFAAAARIRHPDADDAQLAAKHGDLGPDAAQVARYTWRVSPRKSAQHVFHDLVVTTATVPGNVSPDLLAVVRHAPAQIASAWYSLRTFAGIDEGAIFYSATLLPSSLDAYFAEGARTIGNNLDWWEAQWQNKAFLRLLLDPTAGMTLPATLLLALGLAGKEPGQTAIAIDALVQAHADARLNAADLGHTMRDLLAAQLAKSSRYAKSLRAALRIDTSLSAPVFEVLCKALEASPDEPPKDTAMLLELLQELMLAHRLPLPERARETIGQLKLGGKGRALQKSVLLAA